MKIEKETAICSYGKDALQITNFFTNSEIKFLDKIYRRKVKLILEEQEPILNEKEKEYLSGVIKPFRNQVESIRKVEDMLGFQIIIEHRDGSLYFPYYADENKMYTNMELDKVYTLEELDL